MNTIRFEPISTDYILFKKKFEECVEITQKTTSIPLCAPWDDKYIGNLNDNDLWVCWLSGGTGSYPRVHFSGKIKEEGNKIVVEGSYRYDKKNIVFDAFFKIILIPIALFVAPWFISVAYVLIWSVITLLSNKKNKEKIKELLESL